MANGWLPARFSRTALAALLAAALLGWIPRAHAANPLNLYLGAAYGKAQLRAQDPNPIPGDGSVGTFDGSDSSAYQFTIGVRPLSWLGAEVDYVDLGSRGASVAYANLYGEFVSSAHISQDGEAAFAMVYLPVPIIDLYLKAGVDRMTTSLRATAGFCLVSPCQAESVMRNGTTTGFAAGGGVQWKLGNWAVRVEYERFSAFGEHPDLVSLGMNWTF